jgi:hypothetical protein
MPGSPDSSLARRLARLGVKVGTSGLNPPGPVGTEAEARPIPAAAAIERVVEGRFIAVGKGETFVAEQEYPLDYVHGIAPLSISAPLDRLADWAGEPRLSAMPLGSLAFLDAETSGLAGGTGTYAFLVGVGRFTTNGFQLVQFFMRDPAQEVLFLDGLAGFLAGAQALVTFNGKAFDAPLLSTRYTLHGMPLPFQGYAHLDLLPLARRLWRDRLPSRALKYLEANILLAPRSVEEVPGNEIPFLYFDYLRSGDARPLKGVFYHNAMDIVALAALTGHVSAILQDPFDGHVEHGLDFIALGKLFEQQGDWELSARLYERGLEEQLPEADFWQAARRLSVLQRRRGDLESAVRLWKQSAAQGHIYAHIELAKYYEHHVRNVAVAAEWTSKAIKLAGKLDLPRYEFRHWMEDLEHRQQRLQAKLQRQA